MSRKSPTFTFGIEEEYSLVDLTSRSLVRDTPPKLLKAFEALVGERFSTEYMRSQIEVGTSICETPAGARVELAGLRRTLVDQAASYGIGLMAAATHPFSRWSGQRHRDTPRYREIAESFQTLGRQMVINGLHVHVAIEDDEARIAVMNAMRDYLPLLLALSGSSPFWQGENTGLKSFRSAINDSTPRSGIPETFTSWADYQRAVGSLSVAGVIEDATKLWWDLRPSSRFPTLEMRVTDVCPRLEDAVALASLYRCLCRYLWRTRNMRARMPLVPLLGYKENRWRAERYGVDEGLINFAARTVEPFTDGLARVLDLIAEDAAFFDCEGELDHVLRIARRGTSADRQVACYRKLRRQGQSHRQSLAGVVDLLLDETAGRPRGLKTQLGQGDPTVEAVA